ncbi:MAG: gliding motility-associated C-terminal domain-containing protein [Bacteroidia bacterium]|nr:gliding motility-associated C-terminal domain-containing protein [Bacteroidia bacterium]
MKYCLLFIFGILTVSGVFATHNRAGEIRYRHISGNTYEITMVTYTYTLSQADRPELTVDWGDGSSTIVGRISKIELPNDYYYKNTYMGTHTYAGPGIYIIVMMDENRNFGVQNIPNSVNVPFTIRTTLNISSAVGSNSTPILTYPPIDKAKLYNVFIHNPGAWDPDGDSLSYKLTVCLGDNAQPIPGYTIPYADNNLTVDPITGDLIWDSPQQTGIYNVAMLIEEWRLNSLNHTYIKIGEILRDIQVEVVESTNIPPLLSPLKDLCVEAGTIINFPVSASDINGDNITLNAYGGPFQVPGSVAIFDTVYGHNPSNNFYWHTECIHVKKFPYLVVFRAKDNNSQLFLVDQKKVYIKIISPAPQNLTLTPTTNSVFLDWDSCRCSEAVRYDIYRRNGPSGWNPDSCETGVPAYTGFIKIGSVTGVNNTTFLDNNDGLGLPLGYEFCYRVDAVFSDEAESYASNEACTELVKGIPVITHVSISKTDINIGKIYVEWSKPTEFDTIVAAGPYKYLIYRSPDFWGQSLQLIDSLSSINDTIFVDSLENTVLNPYSYRVEFYNDAPGNRFLIGTPNIASSPLIIAIPDDNRVIININKNVPWQNFIYNVYRLNQVTLNFDSIGNTTSLQYVDSGLVNGMEYCYKVKTVGDYSTGNYVSPIINYSQEVCALPIDTTPPCSPGLNAHSDCNLFMNHLVWTNPNHFCTDDVTGYNIYYSSTLTGNMLLIATKNNPNDTTFEDNRIDSLTLAGCYIVTAVDSFLNESRLIERMCVDECTYYELPNIFTPDENGQNDLFIPGPYKYVEKVDMKIFNRWGKLVYQTSDPDIKWDGRDVDSKKIVSPGVYYYICDVYERRLSGIESRTLTGFIEVRLTKKSGTE